MKQFLELIDLVSQILKIAQAIQKEAGEKAAADWLSDLDKTTDDLAKAKTVEEKLDAARRLADLTRRLRP